MPGDTEEGHESPLIVPLAVPLIAGPSSMTVVILLAKQNPDQIWKSFIALIIAWILTSVILLLSDVLGRLFGPRILKAIERLMGMILTTIAIQMLLTGIQNYITILN
jgi:multiple antibiotic resistance protein